MSSLSSQPLLVLAPNGDQWLQLLSETELVARWSQLPLAFTLIGTDRFDPLSHAARPDPSAVGAHLAGRTDAGRFVIAAAPTRDHPYNLARRVASLGHLSHGRSGVLIGATDTGAPVADALGSDVRAWGSAGLGTGAAATVETALEVAQAIRELELSWPLQSVISDVESGILVQSNLIHHVDLAGAFPIAGPLNTPTPSSGASVLLWWAATRAPLPEGAAVELSLGPGGDLNSYTAADAERLRDAESLVLQDSSLSARDLLAAAERLLGSGRWKRLDPSKTLREALGLPAVSAAPGRPAFATPRPLRAS